MCGANGTAAAPAARCRIFLRWGSFVTSPSQNMVQSLCLDVGRPDHLGPFLGFVAYELGEVGGGARKRHAAHIGKQRLDLGVGESAVYLSIELFNNIAGRI